MRNDEVSQVSQTVAVRQSKSDWRNCDTDSHVGTIYPLILSINDGFLNRPLLGNYIILSLNQKVGDPGKINDNFQSVICAKPLICNRSSKSHA